MNRDLISQLAPLVERLQTWYGSQVEIVEQITRAPGNLDRHFTTRSSFIMHLENVGIAFSGANLMLHGNIDGREAGYQATVDRLEELTIGAAEIVFVERFGKMAERHSTFKLVTE